MATWFRKSFRPSTEELPEALGALLDEVRREKGELREAGAVPDAKALEEKRAD